ncbi:MAG: MOSC domain-containing protein [Actinobacteria bacterium]|nr:MOSC domain-containing protein [Actinomycetota bacterium]
MTTADLHQIATEKLGAVVSLWRYPVKSMMGEELNAADVTERGLVGDRAYALIDASTGKVASAKNPKKWPNLFFCRAAFIEPPRPGENLPPVRITLPDGAMVTSEQRDLNRVLSDVVGREVIFGTVAPQNPSLEEYWPDMQGLAHRDTLTDETMQPHTFFDSSVIHILTTATIDRLRELNPEGRFEARRFRPNIVVEVASGKRRFAENEWVDRTLAIGERARIRITRPCSRCVMITLPQGDLPKDPSILRTAAEYNGVYVGAYADVLAEGPIRRGDLLNLA